MTPYKHMGPIFALSAFLQYLSVLCLCHNGCAYAGRFFPAALQRGISHPIEPNINLTLAMIEVQSHVQRIENLPPCKRFASKKLVNSCLAFDNLHPENRYGTDDLLERFRNMFALRMTHCELSDADVFLPRACEPFINEDPSDSESRESFAKCLHELHQTPSSWDSFNHAKTRAAIICHAMRSEIDKDEQLRLFNLLFGTVSNVVDSLEESNQEFLDARTIFRELRSDMREFYIKLHSENDDVRAVIQHTWAGLETRLLHDMSDVADKIDSILGSMSRADNGLDDFSAKVGQVLQNAVVIGGELESGRRHEMDQFRAAIEASRDWFAFEVELALRNFTQLIYGVTKDLQLANDLSGTMANALGTNNAQLKMQIEHMAEMRSVSISFATDQESSHAEVMRRLEDISLKASQILESLEAASEYAQKWKVAMTFALDFISGSIPFRFAFYFGLFSILTLLSTLWYEIPWAVATMISFVAGLVLSTVFTFVMSPVSFFSSFFNDHQTLLSKLPFIMMAMVIFLAGMLFQGMHQRTRSQQDATNPKLRLMWLKNDRTRFQHINAYDHLI